LVGSRIREIGWILTRIPNESPLDNPVVEKRDILVVARWARRVRLRIIMAVLGVCLAYAHLHVSEISTGTFRTPVEEDLTQAPRLDVTLDGLEVTLSVGSLREETL
jgi:hypothetical protein